MLLWDVLISGFLFVKSLRAATYIPIKISIAPKILVTVGVSCKNMIAKIVDPIGSPINVMATKEAGR